MMEPRFRTRNFPLYCKHDRCHWPVSSAADEPRFTLVLEIAVKSIMAEQSSYTLDALRGKHIVIDDNRIILCIIKRNSLKIE